jgi:glutamate synthase (NADPH/NADH) large chain
VDEMVGRVDMLEVDNKNRHWKTKDLDLSAILYRPELPIRFAQRKTEEQKNQTINVLDRKLIEAATSALEKGEKFKDTYTVRNTDRSLGTMVSGEVTRRYGDKGLPPDTIDMTFVGTAGQSFGAFAAPGITLRLLGDANDYVGKGLSGGKIIIAPHKASSLKADENIIAGNTLLYGATSGEAYISGNAGERFAVRNSGAIAVVEGVGDHGCEYMTGGRIVILGKTGRNFGAGMSGGIAYILDEQEDFSAKCNFEMIELEPLQEDDIPFLKDLIENHVRYTSSQKGRNILANWDVYSSKFVRIINPQYREIIEKSRNTTTDSLVVNYNG